MSKSLLDKLCKNHSLSLDEYEAVIENFSPKIADYAREKATIVRENVYGKDVYIRGLIEISNICKNDCFYCGIKASNKNCDRYRLSNNEILECCEDGFYTDIALCDLVERIKKKFPDCAITLSLGERSFESYKKLKESGADRYLLRHETADSEHYSKLHPENLTLENRLECLNDLKKLGFQVGCGFMVGSPYQTAKMLAKDLKFIEEFKPDMCGIGPFIPHIETPFKDYSAGNVDFTCYLLSIIRLIHPTVLLPATTALGTLEADGREKGILAGANVVMPNLTPKNFRKKYMLYNNKLSDGEESACSLFSLKTKIENIGFRITVGRGDRKEY